MSANTTHEDIPKWWHNVLGAIIAIKAGHKYFPYQSKEFIFITIFATSLLLMYFCGCHCKEKYSQNDLVSQNNDLVSKSWETFSKYWQSILNEITYYLKMMRNLLNILTLAYHYRVVSTSFRLLLMESMQAHVNISWIVCNGFKNSKIHCW